MDKIFAAAQKSSTERQQTRSSSSSSSSNSNRSSASPSSTNGSTDGSTEDESRNSDGKKLPKGVVLGPDGKPCRTCTSISAWRALTKSTTSPSSSTTTSTTSPPPPPTSQPECPPDVETLGRSTWTLLHTLTSTYPLSPTPTQQSETLTFLNLFSKLYPCWTCATDFRSWMSKPGNSPRLGGRQEFGNWMCEAHNEVNEKLGKERFDCSKWEERWRTGGSGC